MNYEISFFLYHAQTQTTEKSVENHSIIILTQVETEKMQEEKDINRQSEHRIVSNIEVWRRVRDIGKI